MKFCFVGIGATRQLNANATEGASSLDTSGPVQVAISNDNGSVLMRSTIKKEVIAIAVDRWEWFIREFITWVCMPKVDTIGTCAIEVSNYVLESVVVVFGRC